MEKIRLGIDIGTQFCYAGCVHNNKFYNLIPDEVSENGLPTQIANSEGNKNDIRYLSEAENVCQEENSRFLLSVASIKSALRSGGEFLDGFNRPLDANEIFKKFILQVKDEISKKLTYYGFIVDEIVCTFPNPLRSESLDVNEYCRTLKNGLAKAFNINQEKVNCQYEGEIAAFLLGEMYRTENDVYPHFITVDVGAGTTDCCFMARTGDRYALVYQNSEDFGGKEIDRHLANNGLNIVKSSAQQVKKWKIWLYDEEGQGDDFKLDGYTKFQSRDRIRERLALSENDWKGKIKSELNELWNNVTSNEEFKGVNLWAIEKIKIILMGGSCHLPFVKEAVDEFRRENGSNFEIEYFANFEVAKKLDLNDANFLSFAAAMHDNKKIIKEIQGERNNKKEVVYKIVDKTTEDKTYDIGAPFYYAIKDFNSDFHIITDIKPQRGDYFYSDKGGWHDTKFDDAGNYSGQMKMDASCLYKLTPRNKNFKLNKKVYKEGEDADKEFKTIEQLKDGDYFGFYGYTKNNKGYYIGTIYHYVPKVSRDSKFELYIFPYKNNTEDEKDCYILDDIEEPEYKKFKRSPQKRMTWQEFKSRMDGVEQPVSEPVPPKPVPVPPNPNIEDYIKRVKYNIKNLEDAKNEATKRTIFHRRAKKNALNEANDLINEFNKILNDLNYGNTVSYVNSFLNYNNKVVNAVDNLKKFKSN